MKTARFDLQGLLFSHWRFRSCCRTAGRTPGQTNKPVRLRQRGQRAQPLTAQQTDPMSQGRQTASRRQDLRVAIWEILNIGFRAA